MAVTISFTNKQASYLLQALSMVCDYDDVDYEISREVLDKIHDKVSKSKHANEITSGMTTD